MTYINVGTFITNFNGEIEINYENEMSLSPAYMIPLYHFCHDDRQPHPAQLNVKKKKDSDIIFVVKIFPSTLLLTLYGGC